MPMPPPPPSLSNMQESYFGSLVVQISTLVIYLLIWFSILYQSLQNTFSHGFSNNKLGRVDL